MAYLGNDLQVAFPSYRLIDDISASFNGVLKTFALTIGGASPVPFPINPQQCLISVNGTIQKPDPTGTAGFTLTGTNIVFASAPTGGWAFFGVILAGADYVNAGANFPDGQVNAPSITFDQDTDTGFYRSGSGAVSFASNGVGTATLGSASFTAPSFIPTSSTVPTNGVYLPAANSVAIATNSAHRIRIDSSGNVGIGTTSPGEKLHISGGEIRITSSNAGISNATTRVHCYESGGSTAGYFGFSSGGGIFYHETGNTNPIRFFQGGSEAARIDGSSRLLVGTSTARANFFNSTVSPLIQQEGVSGSSRFAAITYGTNAEDDPIFILGKHRGASVGGTTVVNSGDGLGKISFQGSDGTEFVEGAAIRAEVDSTPGANDMPGRLVFSTTADGASSPTERMRINQKGAAMFSTTGSFADVNTGSHEMRSGLNSPTLFINNTSTSGFADTVLQVTLGYDANTTNSYYIYCNSGGTQRFGVRTNGGIANYSANNVNLSDINAKKDITPAAGTWDCLKDWEIVNFRYKDQPDDADLNLGVIAQQVSESCPEVITVFQEAKEATEDQPAQEERLGVKDQQMMWMAIKALQEAQLRIETLEAKVASLEAQ